MKHALVTGSRGFLGRHMCRALSEAGYAVTGWDGRGDGDALTRFREDAGHYDVVIHAAAVVGGRKVIDGDPLAQAVNLELDAALFRWARRTRPGRVVYVSSSSVYPAWLQRPASESSPHFSFSSSGTEWLINSTTGTAVLEPYKWEPSSLREDDAKISSRFDEPDALYGWTKLTGEKLALLAREAGLAVTVVRPFSGYGEDQDECYPFPAFAARARRRENPFTIWGSAEQVRDWIHVDDVCRAIMIMIECGIDGPVNIGSGQPVTMFELAVRMCRAAGYDSMEIQVLPGQPMGVMYRVADVTKMREFHVPRVSLDEGISRALSWEPHARTTHVL